MTLKPSLTISDTKKVAALGAKGGYYVKRLDILDVSCNVVMSMKSSIPTPTEVRGYTINRYVVFGFSAVTSYPVRSPSNTVG